MPPEFKLAFTDKEITPWSGMIFMKKLLNQTGILSKLIASDLPEQESIQGYAPIQLITSLWLVFGVELTDLSIRK